MKSDMTAILRRGLDQRLVSLREARSAAPKPARGWLRAIRTALDLSQAEVSKKLRVTRQSYAQLETAEERGTISLGSLQRAAEAMDCELVYFVLPRGTLASSYSELARKHDRTFKHLQASEHSMALEGQAVGDLDSKPPSP